LEDAFQDAFEVFENFYVAVSNDFKSEPPQLIGPLRVVLLALSVRIAIAFDDQLALGTTEVRDVLADRMCRRNLKPPS
jgi:hypothetical protein